MPPKKVGARRQAAGGAAEVCRLGVAVSHACKVCCLQAAGCQAQRCYFVAHTHLAAGRRPEAAALFQRTLEQIKTAVSRHQVLTMNYTGPDAFLPFTLTMNRSPIHIH